MDSQDQNEGRSFIKIAPDEEIDGGQIRKAGKLVTAGQRRQLLRVLAAALGTRCLAEKRGILAEGQTTCCPRGKGQDDQTHRL